MRCCTGTQLKLHQLHCLFVSLKWRHWIDLERLLAKEVTQVKLACSAFCVLQSHSSTPGSSQLHSATEQAATLLS